MTQLPKDGRSQEIGRLAGRALANKLPKSWIEKELDGDSDFGIDYLVQLKNDDNHVYYTFYLQLKGTTAPEYSSDRKYVSHDFKVSTLNFYNQQEPLVMVAVVDLKGNEDELWKCPIYYYWLDEDWFSDNKSKLNSQKTISVSVPTTQLLEQSLDVYSFYAKRIGEKFALAELVKEIKPHSENVPRSITTITDAIADKPILLKTMENNGDEPWIENPRGEIPTLLKECSNSLSSNRLDEAKGVLAQLEAKKPTFTPHELAEYYYQEAALLSREGEYLQANTRLEASSKLTTKDRYKLEFIESKFMLSELPSKTELLEIAESLSTKDYRNTIIKAKCLALVGSHEEALKMLRERFPEKVLGQLIITAVANNEKLIEQIFNSINESDLDTDQERFIYHSIAARRAYFSANSNNIPFGKVIPIQGNSNVNLQKMKIARYNLVKAWNYAKMLGYPSNVGILFDISPLIFSYFNCNETLFSHYERLLDGRPNHTILIKNYSRLLFNERHYEKIIKVYSNVAACLDIDDKAILILSNYYLRRFQVALDILIENEDVFVKQQPENTAFIFCIGSELAEELLEDELAKKYIRITKEFDSGDALLAISNFTRKANNDSANSSSYAEELFEDYIRLEKPIIIAEQLFRFLSPLESSAASKIITLAKDIKLVHDLFEHEYFHLTQALMTLNRFDEALQISQLNIDKGNFNPHWHIIKAACLHNNGKIGLAHDELKSSLEKNKFSSEHLKRYVGVCIKLGLLSDIEEALVDLLSQSDCRSEKLSFLSNLISIYSTEKALSHKLKNSIRRFGQLVDKEDGTEEGQFLVNFLTLYEDDGSEEIEEYKQRLAAYPNKFPDSQVLKQGYVNVDAGPEGLLKSINQLIGINDETIRQWEKNKNNIRSGRLPVPFFMLERFISNSDDIFASWAKANTSSEDQIELKLHQAPQLNQTEFYSRISKKKSLIIEDSSLLILGELGILDEALNELDEFFLLNSTFDRISSNNHPLAGTIHKLLPKRILDSINKHNKKLVLLAEDNSTPFEAIKLEVARSNCILLTDDIQVLRFVSVLEASVISSNSYNIIEYLFSKAFFSEQKKYMLISEVCSLGVHKPNMSISLLADSLAFFCGKKKNIEYTETAFRVIFDKVFSSQRDTDSAIELFFKTLLIASNKEGCIFNSGTLASLFRGLLIRHQYTDFQSFSAFWFVFQCMNNEVYCENNLLSTSRKHVELWETYKEIFYESQTPETKTSYLIYNIVKQIFLLDDKYRDIAYQNIKSCFIPLTKDAELFESTVKELSINRQIVNMKN